MQELKFNVIELDLQMSSYDDILKLSLNNFRQELEDCFVERLFEEGIDYISEKAEVLVRSHFNESATRSMKCEKLRLK